MTEEVVKLNVRDIIIKNNFEELKGLNVLVTGGAGFLGSWFIDVLIEIGAQITCLDDFSSGVMDNVKHLIGYPRFKLSKMNISEAHFSEKYDYIVHMAGKPSPDDYIKKPVETILPNSLGLIRILDHARMSDAKVLYTSTSEVYGDAKMIPTPETYWGSVNPVGIRSCYDESKRFGDALCMAYFREFGVDVRIARIFNSYGPRLDARSSYARVVSKFIIQTLKDEPLTVHGKGSQTRSFCYVSDTIICLVKMLLKEGIAGEIINIGSPYEVSIIELAKLIRKLTGSKSKITFSPLRPDDPKRRCPDISKAEKVLEWMPTVALEEGLSMTVEWFKGVLK